MGKPSAPVVGFWYRLAAHFLITPRKVNGFLAFNGGSKTAWTGSVTESGTVHVDAPKLWGGEKDQGGIVTDMDFMFGDDDQLPNSYLVGVFGEQTAAWRGWTGVSLNGGRYGAMNPYPQKPSWKFWRTTAGWNDDECWYEEKCEIGAISGGDPVLGIEATDVWQYRVEEPGSTADYSAADYDHSGWDSGPGGFGTNSGATGTSVPVGTFVDDGVNRAIWLRRRIVGLHSAVHVSVSHDDTLEVWWNGTLVQSSIDAWTHTFDISADDVTGNDVIAIRVIDAWGGGNIFASASLSWSLPLAGMRTINPAHVLYESLTAEDMGREPAEGINDDSFTAAADTLYSEGFGICPRWDSGSESLEDFRARIEKLIGGSLNRSVEDGKWYLDLARGDYVLADLPILTDDDILDFKEQTATLDNAINSVAVKWLDPETNTRKTTAPVRALGLIRQFGTIHQVYDYPEIPTEALALRVAQRELLATTTPTRAFDCAWKPTVYKLRRNQYFRLQAPKRGIADMVCIVGEKQHGTLKSGAIKMKAVQDIYGMPATAFTTGEPGVDTRPPQTPNAITLQRAIEAPYIEVAAALRRADLGVLPADVGFALGMAAQPAGELDFTMMVDAGGGYEEGGNGEWAATATVNEAAAIATTGFTLANGKNLDQVTVGMAALWDDEIVRVDAIDADAGTITLARGCADTVPPYTGHAADSRLWFYEVGAAYDQTEYTDGETVDVKLLPNTGSQQLAIGSATPMEIEFNQRQARPYPPAKLRINGEVAPSYLFDVLTVTWVHRDRVGQADQLVDTEAATTGPEAGTTYTMRTYLDGVLDNTQTGISGTTATVTPSGDGTVRIELESERDSLVSWQAQVREFAYTAIELEPLTIAGDAVTILGDLVYME